MKTVRQLKRRVPYRDSVVWEEKLDSRTDLRTITVFRRLPGGGVETYVSEWGVPVHVESWATEEEAVMAVGGRMLGTAPDPERPRTYDGPPPATVEDLKDGLAELGLDPDQVTRQELLRWAGAGEAITVVETRPDGTVRTYVPERGVENDPQEWPNEQAAIERLARRLDRARGRVATDLEVERMRARARRMREIYEQHGGRQELPRE